jgi:hypothetical protein
MPFSYWLAAAALLPLTAIAGQTQPAPADAQAPVPVYGYQSSFQQYRAVAEETQSPDMLWGSANEALSGHAMHDAQSGEMKGRPAKQDAASGKTSTQDSRHGHHGEGH